MPSDTRVLRGWDIDEEERLSYERSKRGKWFSTHPMWKVHVLVSQSSPRCSRISGKRVRWIIAEIAKRWAAQEDPVMRKDIHTVAQAVQMWAQGDSIFQNIQKLSPTYNMMWKRGYHRAEDGVCIHICRILCHPHWHDGQEEIVGIIHRHLRAKYGKKDANWMVNKWLNIYLKQKPNYLLRNIPDPWKVTNST